MKWINFMDRRVICAVKKKNNLVGYQNVEFFFLLNRVVLILVLLIFQWFLDYTDLDDNYYVDEIEWTKYCLYGLKMKNDIKLYLYEI